MRVTQRAIEWYRTAADERMWVFQGEIGRAHV